MVHSGYLALNDPLEATGMPGMSAEQLVDRVQDFDATQIYTNHLELLNCVILSLPPAPPASPGPGQAQPENLVEGGGPLKVGAGLLKLAAGAQVGAGSQAQRERVAVATRLPGVGQGQQVRRNQRERHCITRLKQLAHANAERLDDHSLDGLIGAARSQEGAARCGEQRGTGDRGTEPAVTVQGDQGGLRGRTGTGLERGQQE
jgi:hypothetical protein